MENGTSPRGHTTHSEKYEMIRDQMEKGLVLKHTGNRKINIKKYHLKSD